jgi:hypothetical protein
MHLHGHLYYQRLAPKCDTLSLLDDCLWPSRFQPRLDNSGLRNYGLGCNDCGLGHDRLAHRDHRRASRLNDAALQSGRRRGELSQTPESHHHSAQMSCPHAGHAYRYTAMGVSYHRLHLNARLSAPRTHACRVLARDHTRSHLCAFPVAATCLSVSWLDECSSSARQTGRLVSEGRQLLTIGQGLDRDYPPHRET